MREPRRKKRNQEKSVLSFSFFASQYAQFLFFCFACLILMKDFSFFFFSFLLCSSSRCSSFVFFSSFFVFLRVLFHLPFPFLLKRTPRPGELLFQVPQFGCPWPPAAALPAPEPLHSLGGEEERMKLK